MITKICPYCGDTFEEAHGNSVYCPGEICESETRKLRSKNQYATKSLKADPLWLNEKILREHYKIYGHLTEIDPDELASEGFEFNLSSEEKKVNDDVIYCMRKFGFSFLKNKKLILWKL